jgi:hypothetical protein
MRDGAAGGPHGPDQTPQVPPYPMVTVASSTITGTLRCPLVCRSISSRSGADFFTFR